MVPPGREPPLDLVTIAKTRFIGRSDEWKYLKSDILLPEVPTHNILWIWGPPNIGKIPLLADFIEATHVPYCQDYCVVARLTINEPDPEGVLFNFFKQLYRDFGMTAFQEEYTSYRRNAHKPPATHHVEQTPLEQAPPTPKEGDMTPVERDLFIEGIRRLSNRLGKVLFGSRASAHPPNTIRGDLLDDLRSRNPLGFLTQAFIDDLNQLTQTEVKVRTNQRGRRLLLPRKRHRRVFLIFNLYDELAPAIKSWLEEFFFREDFTHQIGSQIVLVIPARVECPSDLVQTQGSPLCSRCLGDLKEQEVLAYLERRGITDRNRRERIWALAGRSENHLNMLLTIITTQGAVLPPSEDIERAFLDVVAQREQGQEKRFLLRDASLFYRPFKEADLAAFSYVPEEQCASLCEWLLTFRFVQQRDEDGRYFYDPRIQEAFSKPARWTSRATYESYRQALANHEQRQLDATPRNLIYTDDYWLDVVQSLAAQWLFLRNSENHARAVGLLLDAYEHAPQTQKKVLKMLERLVRTLERHAPRISRTRLAPTGLEVTRWVRQYLEADQAKRPADALSPANRLLETVLTHDALQRSMIHLFSASAPAPDMLTTSDRATIAGISTLYRKRGELYLNSGEYDLALKDLKEAIDLNRLLEPNRQSALAYALRGETYRLKHKRSIARATPYQRTLANDDLKRALDDLDQAIKLNPDVTAAYVSRGKIRQQQELYALAAEDFERAIKFAPGDAHLYADLGLAYRNLKNHESYLKALENFELAIKLDENFAEAYADRGITYRQMAKYPLALEYLEKALEDLNKALEFKPELAWAHAHRGRTHRMAHHYLEALEDFDFALKHTFTQPWVYLQRGLTYLELRDLEHAIEDFETTWTIKHTDINAQWMGVWAEMCQAEPHGMTAHELERIAKLDRSQYASHICLGVALWLRKQPANAIGELEQAEKVNPEEWDAPFWLGMAYASLGQNLAAKAALERSVKQGLPKILLKPLRWLEHTLPGFYAQYGKPFLYRYDPEGLIE